MAKTPKCRQGQHDDVLVRGGKRVRCRRCGDQFPCTHECDHYDCKWVRDDGEDVWVHAGGHHVAHREPEPAPETFVSDALPEPDPQMPREEI